MFNITVLKLKDILKYFIGIISVLIVIIYMYNSYFRKTESERNILIPEINIITEKNQLECLKQTIPLIYNINEKNKNLEKQDNKENQNILTNILESQISSFKIVENINESNILTSKNEDQSQNEEETENDKNITTEIITKNPIKDGSNIVLGNVKIKNETNYQLTEDLLNNTISIENKNIILFHTHSCESYTSSEKYPYTPTGNYRTTDLNFTVTRVGTELETYLKKYNYNVVHNTDYHDYPAYNGSYTRSLKTVENILQTTPSDIIIDIHRDAIGSRNDYAPTVRIGDEEAAQLMFVIGTDAGGLWHPNWRENLKFALKIQSKAEEMYPGLFKTMMLTESRYNQHTGKYASIIEVGATGNTLEQCLTSMKYLAEVMHEVMRQ